MTLQIQQLIDLLKQEPASNSVVFDFCHRSPTGVGSYRGYYTDLAIGHGYGVDECTVGQLILMLENAIGKKFTGWKGGEFLMTPTTEVWVANPGEIGSEIVGLADCSYRTVIETAFAN